MFRRFLNWLISLFEETVPTPDQIFRGEAPLWLGLFYAQRAGQIVRESRLAELAPMDVISYCPRYFSYSREERYVFWEFFLSCMATKESSLDTNTEYTENFRDARGNLIISRGLFQLSVESVNGYVNHGIGERATEDLLHDPYYNLNAAIVILKRWVTKDNRISSYNSPWQGGSRYWSVLRNNGNHQWIKDRCLEAFGES